MVLVCEPPRLRSDGHTKKLKDLLLNVYGDFVERDGGRARR